MRRWGAALGICAAIAWGGGARAEESTDEEDTQELVPGGEPSSVLEGVEWLPFSSESAVAWSPDGKMLATARERGILRLWDVTTGREVRRWAAPTTETIVRLEWKADGRTLVLTPAVGDGILWDKDSGVRSTAGASGEPQHESPVKEIHGLSVVAMGGDGIAAVEGPKNKTLIIDRATGAVLRSIPSSGNPVQFDPTGRRILIGTAIWDVPSGRIQSRLRTPLPAIDVSFLKNHARLAKGHADGTLRLWDVDRGLPTQLLLGSGQAVADILDLASFAKCSTCVAVGYRDGVVRVWNTETGRDAFEPVRVNASPDLGFDPKAMEITAVQAENLHVWTPGDSPSTIGIGGAWAKRASDLSPRAPVLAFNAGGDLVFWDLTARRETSRIAAELWDTAVPPAIVWSPDGLTIAAAPAGSRSVGRWDVGSRKKRAPTLEADAPIVALAFHAGGRWLTGALEDGTVVVWDGQRGGVAWKEQIHPSRVDSIAFHPERDWIASSSSGLVAVHGWDHAPAQKRLFVGGRAFWVGVDDKGLVHRRDPGGFLQRIDKDGTLHPVLPPGRGSPSLRITPKVLGEASVGLDSPGDTRNATAGLDVQVENTGSGPAYWVTLELEDAPEGLVLLDPPALPRLDPGASGKLHASLSWSPTDVSKPQTPELHVRAKHADGASTPISISVKLRAPHLVYGETQVSKDTIRFKLSNDGDQISGPLSIRARFTIDEKATWNDESIAVANIERGASVDLAVAIPAAVAEAGPFSIDLTATTVATDTWPLYPQRTWSFHRDNLRPSLPFALYGAIGSGALLLAAAVAYARIYRNPLVVRASREPHTLHGYPLQKLAIVDHALARARRRDSTLLAAGISKERWKSALLAARSGESALRGFADATGAVLGDPLENLPEDVCARTLKLPPLVLRFAQETALVVVTGADLGEGPTRKLAEAVHQGGRGPRQALALDLTKAQRLGDALRESAGVRFVVLSENRLRDLLLAERPSAILEQSLREQLEVTDLSPYQTASGVEHDALFFGRERELRSIADRSLRNFILVGARQMGKSALLQALHRRLKAREDLDVHYITLADGDLVHSIRHYFDPGAERSPPDPDVFAKVAAGTSERPRLFLLDEADRFVAEDARRDHAITHVMRKLAQDNRARFVLAGFWELYAATWLDAKHPLLNFAELIRLGPLDEAAAIELATKPMVSLGLCWDNPATVTSLVRGAGYRANLIVLACKALIESLDVSTRVLTAEQLDAVVRGNKDLREQLRVLRKNIYQPLHRAIVLQALLHAEPTGDAILAALRARGIEVSRVAFDQAIELLEVAYVVVVDPEGRIDFPVPWVRAQLARDGNPEDRLAEEVAEWRKEALPG